jgi:hypothetical protein
VAYYLPTFDLINQIAFPRFCELFERARVRYTLNKSEKFIDIKSCGRIIFRTMDAPERIIGYEVGDSVADELDTLKIDKAADVWRRIVARNRQKKPNGALNTAAVATTPEGFRFVYEKWQREPMQGSKIIRASTYSNAVNLPPNYIQSLKDTYPVAMLAAYLEGQFVNLTQGCVYPEFDRVLNASRETVQAGDTLHIGMDFNIGKMAGAVHVMRDGLPHAVAEIVNVLDTPAMIATIKRRFEGHTIIVYPDASGGSRKTTNAGESDLALLRQAGFTVLCATSNPAVRDRVLSVNVMINKDGLRRYKINPDTCPHLVECFEKQAYDKNGEPDKTSGHDHGIDAAGYFIYYRFPIQSRGGTQFKLRGL